MTVGVLSDIHDHLDNLGRALDSFRARGIETLCFLGDFCSPIPARVLGKYAGTVHCVFGNGDGDRFAIRGLAASGHDALRLHGEWADLELDGRRIALTHYPFYARALARAGEHELVLSGHTHERHEERLGGTLWVNPGEILGWKGPPSCAVWDSESHTVEFIEI